MAVTLISWKVTKREMHLIHEITERAVHAWPDLNAQTLEMDLTATHANGCPLDLEGLLGAEPADFTHDIFGIHHHINRNTGELKDFFLPRYSRRDS